MSTLTNHLAASYAMTDADKAHLTDLLAKAYLTAKVTAYRKAATTASTVISLKHPWTPTTADATNAQAWAKQQVESIASTYLDTITSLIDTLTTKPPATEGLDEGLIGGLIKASALAKGLTSGVKAFTTWKAPQIAAVATSSGANAGTQQFIADVLDDPEIDDANGVRVRVVPDTSSHDECAEYAGNTYSLEDSMDLPTLPLHPNCPHELEVYTV